MVTVLWPPTSLAAAAVSTDTIHLTWADSGLDAGYSVERSLDGTSFSAVGTTPRNVTSYSDQGLASATTYYYRVRSRGPRGTASAYSSVVSAMTLGGDINAPS
ncbi:MAG: fibronectin type III domain-containing protein, partial [Deltaproteobacteria bacterium]